MNVYLDIDNTMVSSKGFEVTVAKHLKEFLTNALAKHNVFWLTTHCNGSTVEPLAYLSRFVSSDILELAEKIKPTKWDLRKVDALDLTKDFLWFDDTILPSEEQLLKRANKMDSYIKVDLYINPDFYIDYLAI